MKLHKGDSVLLRVPTAVQCLVFILTTCLVLLSASDQLHMAGKNCWFWDLCKGCLLFPLVCFSHLSPDYVLWALRLLTSPAVLLKMVLRVKIQKHLKNLKVSASNVWSPPPPPHNPFFMLIVKQLQNWITQLEALLSCYLLALCLQVMILPVLMRRICFVSWLYVKLLVQHGGGAAVAGDAIVLCNSAMAT